MYIPVTDKINEILPLYISCVGKMLPVIVPEKQTVTCFYHLFLPTLSFYFLQFLWSIMMEGHTVVCSIQLIISACEISSVS